MCPPGHLITLVEKYGPNIFFNNSSVLLKSAKKLSKYQESFKKNTYKQYEKRQQKLNENSEPVGRKYNNARPVIDPDGVYYKTTGEMCAAWGTKLPTYCNRITKGWSMFAALRGKEK